MAAASYLLALLVATPGAVQGFGVSLGGIPSLHDSGNSRSVARHGGGDGLRTGNGVFSFENRQQNRRSLPGDARVVKRSLNRDGGNEHMDKKEDQQREETEDDPIMAQVKHRDWRLYRAKLISQFRNQNGHPKCGWGDGCWAHELGKVEPGCLLLATEEIWDGPFRQSVVLILSHDHDLGTVGLILNRPGPQRLHTLAGLKPDLAEVFAESQVFDGGPVGLGTMTVVHAAEGAEGSEVVLPGVFAGGFDSLVKMARQGKVAKDRVRFIHGHSAWATGQLQNELKLNQWFVAAAAPELVTAGCDHPTNPLWGKVLSLMGGRYQEVAKRNNGPFA